MPKQAQYWQRLLLFLIMLVGVLACENDLAEVDALTKKVIEVEEGKDIKALFSQSARLKAFLTAPTMRRVRDDTVYTEFPDRIRVEFYDSTERLQNVVQAHYAKYYESLGKVLLKDSVLVYNTSGDTLHCKTLWWNQAEEIFYTDDSVIVNTVMQKLRGTGFWAKADFSKYTIRNTVGTVVIPAENTGGALPDSSTVQ